MRSGVAARAHGRSSCSVGRERSDPSSRSKTSRLNAIAPMRARQRGPAEHALLRDAAGAQRRAQPLQALGATPSRSAEPARVAARRAARRRAATLIARPLRRARQFSGAAATTPSAISPTTGAISSAMRRRSAAGSGAPRGGARGGRARAARAEGARCRQRVKPSASSARRAGASTQRKRARGTPAPGDAEVAVQRVQLGEVADLGGATDVRGGRQQRVLDDGPQQRRGREAERIARERVEQRRGRHARRHRRAARRRPRARRGGLGTLRAASAGPRGAVR